ncbi:MAG TPA: hypothetical protein VFL80_04895 [Thermoanaerobaculia bacterium]|nr:hypothetical protein [Thermoanaerobaculia bacterium]
MTKANCVACQRQIDEAARICPFCGADPATGAKMDTQALLQAVFQPKQLTTSETVLEYARQRQGLVIAAAVTAGFLILAGLHQLVTMRNRSAVTDDPAVPLTEIADLSRQAPTEAPLPLPDLTFPYEGNPRRLQTYILESGAIAPTTPSQTQPPGGPPLQPGQQGQPKSATPQVGPRPIQAPATQQPR